MEIITGFLLTALLFTLSGQAYKWLIFNSLHYNKRKKLLFTLSGHVYK